MKTETIAGAVANSSGFFCVEGVKMTTLFNVITFTRKLHLDNYWLVEKSFSEDNTDNSKEEYHDYKIYVPRKNFIT